MLVHIEQSGAYTVMQNLSNRATNTCCAPTIRPVYPNFFICPSVYTNYYPHKARQSTFAGQSKFTKWIRVCCMCDVHYLERLFCMCDVHYLERGIMFAKNARKGSQRNTLDSALFVHIRSRLFRPN